MNVDAVGVGIKESWNSIIVYDDFEDVTPNRECVVIGSQFCALNFTTK